MKIKHKELNKYGRTLLLLVGIIWGITESDLNKIHLK